mgnify:CR=1 FL=1
MMRPVPISVRGVRLYAALHRPTGTPRGTVLLCPPLLEERKGMVHHYFTLAERLAQDGIAALRFDYRGTGDSEGQQEQMTLDGCIEDIRAACAWLRKECGTPVGLLGTRLGAALAALFACRDEGVASLLLWEPICDGAEFYRQNIRRHIFRRSLIKSGGDAARASHPLRDMVDLDGFVLQRAFCEALRGINLLNEDRPRCPVAIFQVWHRAEPRKDLHELCTRWTAELRQFVLEPFWDRIGYVDCRSLIEASLEWIEHVVKSAENSTSMMI